MDDRIEIAIALIARRGAILVARRAQGKAYGGRWEFPGGKVEPGESPADCIVRELREEMGIAVVVQALCREWKYTYPDGKAFFIHAYWCAPQGVLRLLEHDMMRWVAARELSALDLLEADRVIIPEITHVLETQTEK